MANQKWETAGSNVSVSKQSQKYRVDMKLGDNTRNNERLSQRRNVDKNSQL